MILRVFDPVGSKVSKVGRQVHILDGLYVYLGWYPS